VPCHNTIQIIKVFYVDISSDISSKRMDEFQSRGCVYSEADELHALHKKIPPPLFQILK